jgi:hypothetical protein
MALKFHSRFHSVCIAAALFAAAAPARAQQEDYSSWPYSQKVCLNTRSTGANVAGNVTRFPLLVRLNPGVFRGFSQTLPGGADVRFAKVNGEHLAYEIERWVDGNANNDTAEIWVKIDTVYGNNSTQYAIMFWGKVGATDRSSSAAVFDTAAGFAGVWHLREASGNAADATANANSATRFAQAAQTAGNIGNGQTFDGSGDYFRTGPFNKVNFGGVFTVSAWVSVPGAVASPGALFAKGSDDASWGSQETQFFFGDNTTNQSQQGRYPQLVGNTRNRLALCRLRV